MGNVGIVVREIPEMLASRWRSTINSLNTHLLFPKQGATPLISQKVVERNSPQKKDTFILRFHAVKQL